MVAGNYSLIMFQAILPQILLVVLGAVVLITDLVLHKEYRPGAGLGNSHRYGNRHPDQSRFRSTWDLFQYPYGAG